jgi:toxin ParE1/3/4
MKYEFHPAALQEYAEAAEFLTQQDRQWNFIDTIESAIFQIIGAPERWPIVEGQIRRCLILKFSYVILYQVYPDRIVIAAIIKLSSKSKLLARSHLRRFLFRIAKGKTASTRSVCPYREALPMEQHISVAGEEWGFS